MEQRQEWQHVHIGMGDVQLEDLKHIGIGRECSPQLASCPSASVVVQIAAESRRPPLGT